MNQVETTLYIVRHGESLSNANYAKRVFNIQKDALGTDLTTLGIEQAKEIARKFKNIHFDVILSSHLKRAKSTAEIIARERQLAVLTKETLQERKKGNLGGKSEIELRKELEDYYGNRYTLPENELWKWKLTSDMESAEEAVSRFITTLREIAIAYPGKTVLIVSHGFIMRALLIHLGYATFKELPGGSIQNTGYIKLKTDGIDFFIDETYRIKKQ